MGAVVRVYVAVSAAEEVRLAALGRVAPAPVEIDAVIDTGASLSAVPDAVVRALGVEPVRSRIVEGYDGVPHRHPVFDLRFFSSQVGIAINVLPIAVAGEGRAVESLIGRDVLAQCLLRYDGFHGQFDLAVLGP